MQDWNVVVSLKERGYRRAREFLKEFGEVWKTDFFNVLVLKVNDVEGFVEKLREKMEEDPSLPDCLGHVIPARATFNFQTAMEFEAKAGVVVEPWVPFLAGKTFFVRMHRRGFKDRLSSMDEEHMLADFLMARLEEAGHTARIHFDDPDVVVSVETVGQRAGLSMWTREERKRYPFLQLH